MNNKLPPKENLTALLSEISKCELCVPHLPLGPRPLLKVTSQVKVLVVGQAPGRLAHASGTPWDDKSGDRLRDWLGLSREIFYSVPELGIVPMGMCFPGTGKNGDLPPRKECATAWHERLWAQMPGLQLTLLIGKYAQQAYLPDGARLSVTAAVKAWRDYFPRWLPLPHPSPRNNLWLKSNPWFEHQVIPELQDQIRRLILNPSSSAQPTK